MELLESHNPYDEVLYPGYPFPQTHPDRLATMARLFGMTPAPVDGCRVLELGCGDGGNLIPMAYMLPGSDFVGLDLGARGIDKGRETIEALGLANVRLLCLDIQQAGAELGQFDYVIAHGVYSWVPAAVQDRILAICQERLSPQGVAYISYSVYPGAHLRAMLAEMLQYHTRHASTPGERSDQAQAMLRFLAAARPVVRQEAERLASRPPSSLFHDELAECHEAVYFHEFAARAAGHGLQYLSEADFLTMLDTSGTGAVSDMLRSLAANPIEQQQYLDFANCHRFRQTLLCRAGLPLVRQLEPACVRQFHIASGRTRNQQPEQPPSDHPVAQAALQALIEVWPAALSFDELLHRLSPVDDALLCEIVLAFSVAGLFQLHLHRPQFATTVGERPRASALARLQARAGRYVTNLCHHTVHLQDDLAMRLLLALDGTRDHADLIALMRPFAGPNVKQALEPGLQGLAKIALLEA